MSGIHIHKGNLEKLKAACFAKIFLEARKRFELSFGGWAYLPYVVIPMLNQLASTLAVLPMRSPT